MGEWLDEGGQGELEILRERERREGSTSGEIEGSKGGSKELCSGHVASASHLGLLEHFGLGCCIAFRHDCRVGVWCSLGAGTMLPGAQHTK